jgi:uncharacterized protein (DUF2164 family)
MRKIEEVIKLTKEQEAVANQKISEYLLINYQLELGNIEASSFVDFISQELGKYYYNQGINDAHSILESKLEDLYGLVIDE